MSIASELTVPFTLTYVRYVSGDLFGWLLSLVTLTPIFLVIMYCTIIVIRRDIQTILTFIGQLLGAFVTVLLKKVINIPRPEQSDLKDEGMPSNHSQFVGFFACYYIYQFLSSCKSLGVFYRVIYSFFLLILLYFVAMSRFSPYTL